MKLTFKEKEALFRAINYYEESLNYCNDAKELQQRQNDLDALAKLWVKLVIISRKSHKTPRTGKKWSKLAETDEGDDMQYTPHKG